MNSNIVFSPGDSVPQNVIIKTAKPVPVVSNIIFIVESTQIMSEVSDNDNNIDYRNNINVYIT